MKRYVFTSLAIGGAVLLVVLILYFLQAFEPLANWLNQLYSSKGLFQNETSFRLTWLEILLIAAAAFGVSWCVIDVSQVAQKILVFFSSGLVLFGLSPTLALYGCLVEPFSALAAVLLAGTAAFVFAGTERGMRKRILENVLGSRVSTSTFNELLDAREPPDFSGAVRDVTVLTCRIFNHAELREKLEPAELLRMTNLFLRNAANFLMSKGAYLDESGPELVRVFFGMLEPSDTHAMKACRAALELRSRLKILNQECETRWFQNLEWGVGISSGPMTVGVYGSQEHFYYSGVGSEIDFSRRLAHGNTRYGSDLLISAKVYQIVHNEVELRPLEMFYDPEENVMTEIYQLLATRDQFTDEDRERRDAFWRGLIFYREKRYDEALESFSASLVRGKEDKPARFFIEKCQHGLAGMDSGSKEGHHELTEDGHARLIGQM